MSAILVFLLQLGHVQHQATIRRGSLLLETVVSFQIPHDRSWLTSTAQDP